MRATSIPVPLFLEFAITASARSKFAGLAVIVDREADRQSKLLQQLTEDRASLHDITAEDILIIVPTPSSVAASDTFVLDPAKDWEDGYNSPGLSLSAPADREWAREFWAMAGEPPDMFDAHSTRELASTITQSATATARFLGIDESLVPAACVLSLHDQCAFVFR